MIASAKEAIAIGRMLGDKVILMSCSTGSTLSIYLAAHHPELIHAQMMYSPNIEIYDPNSKLLTGPWGAQLAQQLIGTYYHIHAMKGTESENYWTTTYRTEGLLALQALLDATMTEEIFRKTTTPYLIAYYYKNEEEQDKVISVKAITAFDKITATPNDKKQLRPLAKVASHVLPSGLQSKDVESVRQVSHSYMEKVLGMEKATQPIVAEAEMEAVN